jgi:ABC-type glutathione transport system ATPase component
VIVSIDNRVEPSMSYASERTRGLYNVGVEDGARFRLDVAIPIDEDEWQIGVVVGPSGSGKTSIARALSREGWIEWTQEGRADVPVIDWMTEMAGSYAKATASLAAVGL